MLLLTLLTSKKVEYLFLLPTSYQLKAMLVYYHNFDKHVTWSNDLGSFKRENVISFWGTASPTPPAQGLCPWTPPPASPMP